MSRNLTAALVCLGLIAVITLVSASGIGFSQHAETVASLPRAAMLILLDEGQQHPGESWLEVQRVTYTNTFLPRQVLLPRAVGCLRNDTSGRSAYANLRWNTGQAVFGQYPDADVVRLGLGTKTVTLDVQPYITYRSGIVPRAEPGAPKAMPAFEPETGYTALYLFMFDQRGGFRETGYVPCDNLQPGDLARAKKILLV